jgi:GrpB-like predicted nucleotidyltransferase (UPF0157 family)
MDVDMAELPPDELERADSTKEPGIKQEDAYFQPQGPRHAYLIVTRVDQERAQVLAKRIPRLFAKRKDHHARTESLSQRIRQSRLTYADLLRKRNRLENDLADLKRKLDSDEQLLEAETRSAESIPAEIEQASADLAAFISG